MQNTPRKVRLMKIIKSRESQIRKTFNKRRKDIRSASDLINDQEFLNLLDGMSKITKTFLISQLRCANKKKPNGRRWTLDDKCFALALFNCNPTGYNFLRKLITLPSKRTVLSLLEKVPFKTGINNHIFEHIDSIITTSTDRYVTLIFDEMDIKEHFYYDKKADKILGYKDFGSNIESRPMLASKALVFMVCGLGKRKWKQPVSYYFSNGGCSSVIMRRALEETLSACQNIAHLNVVTTICDMGTTNVKALTDLGVTTEKPFFIYNGHQVNVIFDPPQLLKRTAALFREHNVSLNIKIGDEESRMIASFDDIRVAYHKDCATPFVFRSLHKLRPDHLDPKIKWTMKVNIAAQIMSHTVAAFIYSLTSQSK